MFLSVKEASAYSGISSKVLRELVSRRIDPLPHLRIGRVIKIDTSDLCAYLDEMKVGGPTGEWRSRETTS